MPASFVLASASSSTYRKGTPPVLPSAAALLNGHFEPPVSTAENDFQRRSRFGNILDVPQGYAYGMFSPVALLEDRFERSRGRTKEASVLPSAAAVATHGSDPRLTKNRSASILDSCSA